MYTSRILSSVICLFVLGIVSVMAQDYKTRSEIPKEYKWNLSDIYKNAKAWKADFGKLNDLMNQFPSLRGTLGKSPQALLKALKLQDQLGMLSYKVYQYPNLAYDLNTRDQKVFSRLQQVRILFAKYRTATSWFDPEMLKIPWKTMKKWLDETPELAPYRFNIEDLYRQQKHVLTADKEKLLSYFGPFSGSARSIYGALSTADIKFPVVTLSDGKKVRMSHGNYGKTLSTNRNQKDRRKAFLAHYRVYKQKENTYAAIYKSICERDWAFAQARNYKSCVEASLSGKNIPVSVYENLIKTVKKNVAPLRRYVRLRKKILGIKEYHLYDGGIPIIDFKKEYSYEIAQKWVLASVAPLGKTYQDKMKNAFRERWLDVYESKAKRSGAYSASVYGVHPYMLLNYNKTLSSVFTLAHELGHTMHTLLSDETQPFSNHGYTIFVAEVASTLNERLLLDYLLKRTKNPKERIALLQQSISQIIGTFYSQVMFADFELQAHRLVEQGKPITAAALSKIFQQLYKDYEGDEVVFDKLYSILWARIGHFYWAPFYVYQYATCFASSAKIYDDIKSVTGKEREKRVEKYLNLLRSGGNDYPMAQLKKAGVDLTKPATIKAVVKQLDELVSQLEKEIEKLQQK